MEKAAAFRKAFSELETRIKLFTSLPLDWLEWLQLGSTAIPRVNEAQIKARKTRRRAALLKLLILRSYFCAGPKWTQNVEPDPGSLDTVM